MKAPTGVVLLVGPDGAGKSTIADELERLGPSIRVHWRPGILGRTRGDGAPVDAPHAQSERSLPASLAKLALSWTDTLLGYVGPWRSARSSKLVIVERGFADQVVDPKRYRLRPHARRLARTSLALLPRADLVVVLSGDPKTLATRKNELDAGETRRQLEAWGSLAPSLARRSLTLDTTQLSPQQCAERIAQSATTPTYRRVRCTPARLQLAATAPASRGAREIYRPMRPTSRARLAVGTVIGRVHSRPVAPPIDNLDDLARMIHVRPDDVAAMRSSAPGRFVIGFSQGGTLQLVAKVARAGDSALESEAGWLLEPPLRSSRSVSAPEVAWFGEWRDWTVLATKAVPEASSGCSRSQLLEIALALHEAGIQHGDLAPWNVLDRRESVVLLDWESASREYEPLWDLAHYIVQEGALLRRHDPRTAVELLTAPTGLGATHLARVGVDSSEARSLTLSYLQRSSSGDRASRFRRSMIRHMS